eukprot:CAMPEP_0170170570 /NCGR_PEP_ID=MMETSP0040_2-20121228/3561_1 /TAXON_ID=641309 /ORGANISM="Lotharella oceanica, Strain CCMP622" /LENGTH=318 /DNA_ID=CAMNT_0010410053 /DNA_START=44 /DNA_END=1000 /DNA_ORIENTATION=-
MALTASFQQALDVSGLRPARGGKIKSDGPFGKEGERGSVWSWWKFVLYGILALALIFLSKVLLVDLGLYERLMNVNGWISRIQGTSGFILLFNLCAIAAAISVPPLALDVVMNIVAGAAYGTIVGTTVYVLGSSFGCCLAFQAFKLMCIPSTLSSPERGVERVRRGGSWLEKYTQRAKALSMAMKDDITGLQITLLLRVSPITPLAVCTALLALTELRFGPYTLGTVLGLIPASLPYCYLGAVGKDMAANGVPRGIADILGYVLGGLATVLVSYKVYLVSERVLNAAHQEKDCEEESPSKELLPRNSSSQGDCKAKER